MTGNRWEMYYDTINSMIEESREKIVENLSKLLMFSTVSGGTEPDEQQMFRNERARAFSFLNGLSRTMGFEWRNYESRLCVIEQLGGSEVVGLPLHIDVVPSGEGWHYPAFGGMVEDGVIYGRGAQDDKGPIIQILYALWIVRRLGLRFRRTVRIIVASQEETGDWEDVASYLEAEAPPDFSIVADSDFPIVNGEKGMADVEIAFEWDETDTSRNVLHFHRLDAGERPNIVPNRADIGWLTGDGQARAVSETLTHCLEDYLKKNPRAETFPLRLDTDPETGRRTVYVTFLGKGAHGSTPEIGHNAALDALDFLADVPELPGPLPQICRFLTGVLTDLHGSGLGIAREHSFVGKTTVNLGLLRVTGRSLVATLNIRPTYGTTCTKTRDAVRACVKAWAAGQRGVRVHVDLHGKAHEPLFVDPEKHQELVHSLQQAYHRVTGETATLRSMGGTTFAKAFPNALNFGPVLVGEEKNLAHQADECIRVEHLLRNVRIYALALLLLAVQIPD